MLGSDLWVWRGEDLSVDQLLRSQFYLASGLKLRSARLASSAILLLEVQVPCNTDSLPVSLFVFLSVRLSVTLLVILDVCVCASFSLCVNAHSSPSFCRLGCLSVCLCVCWTVSQLACALVTLFVCISSHTSCVHAKLCHEPN